MRRIASAALLLGLVACVRTPEEPARVERLLLLMGTWLEVTVEAKDRTAGLAASDDAEALIAYFREHKARIGFDLRTTTLGHVQRGGAPTAYDRLLATRLGAGAVAALARGETGVLVGMVQSRVTTTLLADIVGIQKPIDPELFALAKVLEK